MALFQLNWRALCAEPGLRGSSRLATLRNSPQTKTVLLAEGWYLDPNEASQVLVPPDTPPTEDEEAAGRF